jgi:5'-3' exonuclease
MNPKGRDLVDAAGVQKKFGVSQPASMRDLQALMGDAAVSSGSLSC